MQNVKKAVILAAGFGTRFMPFCKAVNKGMLPIIDTPTIEIIAKELEASGIQEILIVVGYNKDTVINHFSKNSVLEKRFAENPERLESITRQLNIKVDFVVQKIINGTGGALLLAEKWVKGENFVLAFADDLMKSEVPVSKQLIEVFEKTGKMVVGCQNVTRQQVTKYCSVEFSKKDGRIYDVTKVVEKPKLEDVKSTLSCLGRYVLKPNIFDYCRALKVNENCHEICFTDTFTPIAEKEGLIAYDFDAIRYDIGNKFGYLTAIVDYALSDDKYAKDFKRYLETRLNK